MRLPPRPLVFIAGAITVLAGTALAQTIAPDFLFPDVKEGSFFATSVGDLVRKGIVKGYEDGRFGPEDPVTRGQVTVMIDRYDSEVVQPLREQLHKIRELLELGKCGDGKRQVGEECDDGNTSDGDGCSAECQQEAKLEPRGECWITGCSRQLCIERGEGEWFDTTCEWRPEHACYQKSKCERQEGGTCGWTKTPEFLACLEHVEEQQSCGNGICEEGEAAWCPPCEGERCPGACSKGTCPEDCGEQGAKCGNGVCEEGEADVVIPGGCGPDADPGCIGPPAQFKPGTCPKDCSEAIENGYRQMYVQCYDGKESTQGGETSCKPNFTWQEYANDFCTGHCSEESGKCGVNAYQVSVECAP